MAYYSMGPTIHEGAAGLGAAALQLRKGPPRRKKRVRVRRTDAACERLARHPFVMLTERGVEYCKRNPSGTEKTISALVRGAGAGDRSAYARLVGLAKAGLIDRRALQNVKKAIIGARRRPQMAIKR